MSYPDNNPKTAIGATKIPLHLVPPSAKHFLAQALANGAEKYGPYNWRGSAISVSVYRAAAERHWDAFWDGEDLAPDSGVHHLAHAMACCALLLDAMTVGKLHDDRPTKGASPQLQADYVKPPKEHRRVATTEELRAAGLEHVALQDEPAPKFPPYSKTNQPKVGHRVRVLRIKDRDSYSFQLPYVGKTGEVIDSHQVPYVRFDDFVSAFIAEDELERIA